MKLHQLASIKEKRAKRIGRSGKRGSYSGRGVKGQKSRAGRRLRPAERDLILRLPKHRGFRNVSRTGKPVVFNLHDLALRLKSFVQSGIPLEVNQALFMTAGLLRKSHRGEVKLLGGGEVPFPMNVKDIKVSKSARIKIEKAGGKLVTGD